MQRRKKLVCRAGAKEWKMERETAGPASFLSTGSKRLNLKEKERRETKRETEEMQLRHHQWFDKSAQNEP